MQTFAGNRWAAASKVFWRCDLQQRGRMLGGVSKCSSAFFVGLKVPHLSLTRISKTNLRILALNYVAAICGIGFGIPRS